MIGIKYCTHTGSIRLLNNSSSIALTKSHTTRPPCMPSMKSMASGLSCDSFMLIGMPNIKLIGRESQPS